MTLGYFFVFLVKTGVSLVIDIISYVLDIFLTLISSIMATIYGAVAFVSVVLAFLPASWVLSILAGLAIVNAETIIYWLKKIWEVIGIILDML